MPVWRRVLRRPHRQSRTVAGTEEADQKGSKDEEGSEEKTEKTPQDFQGDRVGSVQEIQAGFSKEGGEEK